MKIHDISWSEYEGMLRALDAKLQEQQPEGCIWLYGIPRGGQLVALHLSYLSDRYVLATTGISLSLEGANRVTVVDDILETGKARAELYELLKDELVIPATFAVLLDKSPLHDTHPADVSVEVMGVAEWIKFPYEKLDLEKEKESQKERGYDDNREG